MRVAPSIQLSEDERQALQRWARGRSSQARQVERANIVLLAASGKKNNEIAEELGIPENKVGRWRTRFVEHRLAGIEKDNPRGGRPKSGREKHESEIIRKTTQETPANATHWSTRTLARAMGVNQSLVSRVWRANGLKPHLIRTFKLSNDPHFENKLVDVVGLYLNPPENALVISADEKSQIQALDRTQPGLPIIKGRCGTLTHDYSRHGTTTLFAAIDMVRGKVIGKCMPRHRHQEWIRFLDLIDEETPKDLDIHLIVDNYSTHKHAAVKRWLIRHPRFHVHFTPTSSSWLNVVERFFRDLDEKRLRRDSFKSVAKLIEAIMDYVAAHNEVPRPYVWTARAEEIVEKVGRARRALDNRQTS